LALELLCSRANQTDTKFRADLVRMVFLYSDKNLTDFQECS